MDGSVEKVGFGLGLANAVIGVFSDLRDDFHGACSVVSVLDAVVNEENLTEASFAEKMLDDVVSRDDFGELLRVECDLPGFPREDEHCKRLRISSDS